MINNNPDFIVYNKSKTAATKTAQTKSGPQELSPGLWQKETLDTLKMYSPKEGNFSQVGKQLTLFPMDGAKSAAPTKALNLDNPPVDIPYWSDFRFFGKDTAQQVRAPKLDLAEAPASSHPKDVISLTNGQLYIDGKTEIKGDQFPGRVHYTEGGLYPAGDAKDPKVIEQHVNAPNYRKMPDKNVHGVGQPTKQGFKDVLNHLDAKKKPIVWTNNRAEAIIYIDGKPHNLRELASRENLVLKDGASGAEVEAFEEKLRDKLIARGSLEVVDEVKGDDGKIHRSTRMVKLTPENTQTTKDVINEMREDGYKVEYKRIPIADEKSPTPAQIDATREWMNEVQGKHEGANLDYVFNCHQGRGRTTTGMVAAGIALDGHTRQLELPFGLSIGEDAKERADRIIDDNYHMQNLRETVGEYQKKADSKGKRADQLQAQAQKETDAAAKAKLEKEAKEARDGQSRYQTKTTDFTKRYATMQKYSEYIDKYGAKSDDPSFEDWMKQDSQVEDLDKKWSALNEHFGFDKMGVALA